MSEDKLKRYDRQLRLWETSGQTNLENAHVCLINATPTGSELLKNLVLPGIKDYSIIDDSVLKDEDIAGNFFYELDDIGMYKADAMIKNLNELNPDVTGHSIKAPIAEVIKMNQSFWDDFQVVIISEFCPIIDEIKEILWKKHIPLILINTVGFYGSLQLIVPEITVIETHYPSQLFDLRIDKPWAELQEFSDSIDLDAIDDTEHAHVPYIIIFIKGLQSWLAKHNNTPPKNYAEKRHFKQLIESLARNINLEANFREASLAYHRALQITKVPDTILELFRHPNTENESLKCTRNMFWVYIRALKQFVEKNDNQLPLSGRLPDMASDTVSYVKLQNIYRNKAMKDKEIFTLEVIKVLQEIGVSTEVLDLDSISSFCKNSMVLHVAHGSKELYSPRMLKALAQGCENSEVLDNIHTLAIYFSIITYNLYIKTNGSTPGPGDLNSLLDIFSSHFGMEKTLIPYTIVNVLKELLLHGKHSYHNIFSFMGGIGSQEVLKLLTHQYIPIDNVFVFDGIKSVSNKWKV